MNSKLPDWFEIWFVPGVNVVPSYFAVVSPRSNREGALVIDVLSRKVLYEGETYEDTYFWLTEDEFEVVSGREFANDAFEDRWFEVWHLPDTTSVPGRLVVVSRDLFKMAGISVTDETGETSLYIASNYDLVQAWLVSGLFQMITGRIELSDNEVSKEPA